MLLTLLDAPGLLLFGEADDSAAMPDFRGTAGALGHGPCQRVCYTWPTSLLACSARCHAPCPVLDNWRGGSGANPLMTVVERITNYPSRDGC